jgi:hypothetical protein
MNTIKYFLICFCLAIIAACSDREMEIPSFDVSTEFSQYKAGDKIKFLINGDPGVLTFYSGEPGKRFAYHNRTKAEGSPVMSFTSNRANGTQQESLFLLVSSDFKGIVSGDNVATVQNIETAIWTDITDRAAWSTTGNKASGNIDLSDFKEAPVYIAFKYKGYAGSVQNKWTISAFILKNSLDDGSSYILANHGTAAIANYGVSTIFSPGWVARIVKGQYSWVVGGSNFVMTGSTSAAAAAESEAWCISGPVILDRVSPDVGIGINSSDASVSEYIYEYATAGEYKATFRAANVNIYEERELIKEVDLVIESK